MSAGLPALRFIGRGGRRLGRSPPRPEPTNPGTESSTGEGGDDAALELSTADVLVVKAMLMRAFRLPLEIVDPIMEAAEYWRRSVTRVDYGDRGDLLVHTRPDRLLLRTPPLGLARPPAETAAAIVEAGPSKRFSDGYTIAQVPPAPLTQPATPAQLRRILGAEAPALEHPCRKIVFTLCSHDQGWGGNHGHGPEHPYRGSFTWFDVGLERYDGAAGTHAAAELRPVRPPISAEPPYQYEHPLLPTAYMLQANRTADRNWTEHVITWSHDDRLGLGRSAATPGTPAEEAAVAELENRGRGAQSADGTFVRGLRAGDVVTLWAHSRFGGWTNHIRSVQVEVYWAV